MSAFEFLRILIAYAATGLLLVILVILAINLLPVA